MNILLRTVKLEVTDKAGKKTNFNNIMSQGLRIEFSVNRLPNSNNGGVNSAQIQIYNLSDETFDMLSQSQSTCTLQAGYDEVINTIYVGYVVNVLRRKNGTDIITTLYCFSSMPAGDKDIVSLSCVNIELEDVLKDIAKNLNCKLSITNYKAFGGKVNEYSIFGTTKKALNLLGLKFGFLWYFDNNILYVLPRDASKPNFVINPNTGLLKPPIKTDAGVNIEIFLNPFIAPSDVFELSSKFADYNLQGIEYVEKIKSGGFSNKREAKTNNYTGKYRILMLQHEGSTHTNIWSTKIEGHNL